MLTNQEREDAFLHLIHQGADGAWEPCDWSYPWASHPVERLKLSVPENVLPELAKFETYLLLRLQTCVAFYKLYASIFSRMAMLLVKQTDEGVYLIRPNLADREAMAIHFIEYDFPSIDAWKG